MTVPPDSDDHLPLPEGLAVHPERPRSTSPSVHYLPHQNIPHGREHMGYRASSPEPYDVLSATTAVEHPTVSSGIDSVSGLC
jgi:hypothetical protein